MIAKASRSRPALEQTIAQSLATAILQPSSTSSTRFRSLTIPHKLGAGSRACLARKGPRFLFDIGCERGKSLYTEQ
jgi:hypothetical protein